MKIFVYKKERGSAKVAVYNNVSSVTENKTHIFIAVKGAVTNIIYDKHIYKVVAYVN